MKGHNNPPEPFTDSTKQINDLYEEAKHWLDGEIVDSAEIAEGIADLLNQLREAGKLAKDGHDEEKAPWLKAGREVDDKWRPLTDMVKRATDACKTALLPWQQKIKAEQDAIARQKREEAFKAQQEALEAQQQAATLEAQERADKLREAARTADIQAQAAANAKPGVKVAGARRTSLRTSWEPVLTDPVEAIRYYWPTHAEEFTPLLLKLANQSIKDGQQEIPGFDITKVETVV